MISKKSKWLLHYLIFIPCLASAQIIDLQDLKQDFVVETKQIEIPGYWGAFNPALIRWHNTFLLTFRNRDPITGDTSENGFVILNDEFEVVSLPKPLKIQFSQPPEYLKIQDPRIVAVGQDYYLVFNNQVGMTPLMEIRRMFVAKLYFDGTNLYTDDPVGLLEFDVPQIQNKEKNWVPFAYNNTLLLGYSINPHIILQPIFSSESCRTVASTNGSFSWNWGVPRGGTPAIQIGNQYLGFFHSCKHMITTNSNGKMLTHYFMGAYTFSNKPPFALTGISPEPIVGENFYYGEQYNTWKPLLVVFPVGLVCDKDYLYVSYGRQDYEVWIAKIDKHGLLNSLVPVTAVED